MRRSSVCVAWLAMGTCLLLAWPAVAQQATKGQQPFSDQRFVMLVSADGHAEVDLAKMALKHSSSEEVKAFAQRMIHDHTKVDKELKRLAESKGIPIASEMDKKHRTVAEKLAQLNGAAFDQQYTKDMLNDHKQAIALFEREAKNGQDPELKKFATETLPTLREHMKMARKLAGVPEEGQSGRSGR